MPHKDLEQRRACIAAWHAAHPESRRESRRKRREADPEGIRAYHRAWHAAHPEAKRGYKKTSIDAIHAQGEAAYAAHLEANRAKTRAYNATHKKEKRAATNVWNAEHPDLCRAMTERRRARKALAPLNDFTGAQWTAMKTAYGNKCVYCGRKMQRLAMDHITPISEGGAHTLANIVPACQSCNSKKGTKGPLIPVQPLLFV